MEFVQFWVIVVLDLLKKAVMIISYWFLPCDCKSCMQRMARWRFTYGLQNTQPNTLCRVCLLWIELFVMILESFHNLNTFDKIFLLSGSVLSFGNCCTTKRNYCQNIKLRNATFVGLYQEKSTCNELNCSANFEFEDYGMLVSQILLFAQLLVMSLVLILYSNSGTSFSIQNKIKKKKGKKKKKRKLYA